LVDDEKFVYKKVDNFVVLKVPVHFKPGFNVESQEIYVINLLSNNGHSLE
jgi:hypothetical protein